MQNNIRAKPSFIQKKYIVWAVISTGYLIAMFQRVSPAVVVDKLTGEFNIQSAAIVGVLSSLYFYVYAFLQVPVGYLADTYGARRTVIAGLLVAAASSVFFGMASNLGQIYAARILIGGGAAVIFISGVRMFSDWFKQSEFGAIMGLTIFMGNLGALVATVPFAVLVQLTGWRNVFILIGIVTGIIAIMVVFFVDNAPGHKIRGAVKPIEKNMASPTTKKQLITGFKEIISNSNVWLAFAASFFMYGSLMAIAGVWGMPYLMQVYGLERTQAASCMMMISIGAMIGSITIGFCSDRINNRKIPYITCAVGNLAVWGTLVWWNGGKLPVASIYFIFLMLGFFACSAFLTTVLAKEYCSPAITGIASSFGNMGGLVGAAIIQPLFGYMLDISWDGVLISGIKIYPLAAYRLAFGICFIFACIALGVLILLKDSFKH